ncbi:MAG: tyrosine-type recombinase/integrase [Porphyromonadaceae bacterium]|nr:tyrosine-type recombinase/integrase [Porphyromonadaceae bacterium]
MINRFLQYMQYEKNSSSHTVLSYHTDLVQFCEFLDIDPEEINPDSVDQQQIQHWILSMLNEEKSARTISRKISSLKSFWKYLLLQNITKENPTKKIILPKTNKPLPAFYKQSEMDNFLSDNKDIGGFERVRNRVIIELLYQTGLRVSELTALTDKSIDYSEKQLKVLGKRDKERIIPIGSGLLKEIADYQKIRNKEIIEREDFLFVLKSGKKIYSKAIYNIIKRNMPKYSTLRRQSPHVLRHTFATTLLDNGADINAVKDLLGHSSLAATQVYTHVSFSELNKIYKQAHPRAIKKRR